MSESSQRWLSDLYRASAREEPPGALDSAILAEARRASRSPASRVGWGAPLAAAAVVVLSVTLVIAIRDEPAYRENPAIPPAPTEPGASDAVVSKRTEPEPMAREDQKHLRPSAANRQAQGGARQAEGIAKSDREAPAALKDESSNAVASAPASKAEPSERTASPSAPPSLASPAPAPEAREQAPAQPAAAAPAAAAKTLGRLDGAGDAQVEQRRARASAESDQAGPQTKQGSASSGFPQRLESAVDERVSPEAWLERIAKLRAEGRHAEARESLAAFKKRYPDHPLPDALKSF